jgi:hypothetical protein
MNCISTDGNFKFEIDQLVNCRVGATEQLVRGRWQIKHRYTERFERDLNSISMYVIWCEKSNQRMTVSEVVLRPR